MESIFKATAAAGKANRNIYDSQHTWETQVKLVRSEGETPVFDEDMNNAYDLMGDFRDYVKNKFNRNSLDNNGMDLIGNVHYGEKYNNAFWDGKQMVFGDGDGAMFTSFTKSLDVVAYEMGHGVVHFYADFNYQDQLGALYEHFADMFGSVVTQYIEKETAATADWLIGDEIMGPELYGESFVPWLLLELHMITLLWAKTHSLII
jgi:Zn-dependent metalloprotease